MAYADKPWLKSYKLGPYPLDHSLTPYPEVPVYKALEDAAAKYPGQTAILYQERKISYRELKELSDRMVAALVAFGVRRGDRVCVFMPNCPEFTKFASRFLTALKYSGLLLAQSDWHFCRLEVRTGSACSAEVTS